MITLTLTDIARLSFEARLADELTLSKLECIHYVKDTGRATEFTSKLMNGVKNGAWCKPEYGGLWTSPVDSKFGWKDWCDAEDFRECKEDESFTVKFKDGAKVIIIDSYEDLDKLPSMNPYEGKVPKETLNILTDRFPDFEKLSKEIDAIWLTEEGQWRTRLSHPKNLYGWDCESVLILNPDSIYQI